MMKEKIIEFCEDFADKVDNDTLTVSEFFGLALKLLGAFWTISFIWKCFCFVMGA